MQALGVFVGLLLGALVFLVGVWLFASFCIYVVVPILAVIFGALLSVF